MQCLILAGGLGTRMKGVAGDAPKALLPIGSQTFIDWQLQWLKLLGVTEVIMALGHGGEKIQDHLTKTKNTKNPALKFSFDGPKLLGTGGAIKRAGNFLNSSFFVAYGDSFLFVNLNKLMTAHQKEKMPLTFSIYENQNQGDKSNVIFKDGIIKKYDKFKMSPEMKYIDYGMSAVRKEYFLANTPEGAFDFADFLTKTCDKGLVTPFVVDKIFQEIGSPGGYERFRKMMEGTNFDLQALAHSQSLL